MKIKNVLASLFIFFIVVLFFYKTILHGLVPFPSDLLIAEYNPWKTYSYLGYNPGSFPNKAQYFDVLRQLYPWKTFVLSSIKSGSIPLWNPYNFSGTPLFANFQSAVLYPLNFVYFLLPQIYAWSLLVFLQPLLVGIFSYFFFRKIKISFEASLFSAITFAFCSFSAVWLGYNTIGQVTLWLPLILLGIENLKEKYSIQWSLVLIFSLVSSLLGGHPQLFVYTFIFSLIYLLFSVKAKKQKIQVIFLFLISLGIGGVQLVPGGELIFNAARSPHTIDFFFHKILIQWWQLIMLFIPDIFGNPATRSYTLPDTYVGDVMYLGIIPLFFIPLALTIKKNFHKTFFLNSSVVLLLLLTLNPLSWIFYQIPIPFIGGSGANFLAFLFLFSLSALCGFGFDLWKSGQLTSQFLMRYVLKCTIFAVILSGIILIVSHQTSLHQYFVSTNKQIAYFLAFVGLTSVILLITNKKKNFIYVGIIILLILQTGDLFRFFQKFNPFVPKETVYPKAAIAEFLKDREGINRYWGYGNAYIEANFDTELGLNSVSGYDPLYPKRYGEFILSALHGTIGTAFTDQNRSDAVLPMGNSPKEFMDNPYRLKILNILGIKYILDRVENGSTPVTFPPSQFPQVYNQDGWIVYENKNALPRIFLTPDYKVFKTNAEFEKNFFSLPDTTILLEKNISVSLGADLNSSVKVISYKPNKIVLQTNSKTNQLLFLSDTYFPGWKATIDNVGAEILRTDYAFRSVVVPAGVHTIIYTYEPESFRFGVILSIVSICALFVLLLSQKVYNRSRK